MISLFGAGFLVLAAMTIEAYRWGHDDLVASSTRLETKLDKLDDRTVAMGLTLSKIEQHLQDMQTSAKGGK